MTSHPSVSVVIATLLREQLAEAIHSVRAQRYEGRIEVVVVVDGDERETSGDAARVLGDADRVLFTGGRRSSGYARNVGVASSTGEWVAFLDDDDIWTADKVARQMMVVTDDPHITVVACRSMEIDRGSGRMVGPMPRVTRRPGQPVSEYLFARRGPSVWRAGIPTSALAVRRDVALAVPWDDQLLRHQDWDWLLRLEAHGHEVRHLEHTGVIRHVGGDGSMSGSTNWHASLDWAQSWRRTESRRAYVDFITANTLRYALAARSVAGTRAVLAAIAAARAVPGTRPMAMALVGLLPRGPVMHLASVLAATVSAPQGAGRGGRSAWSTGVCGRRISPTTTEIPSSDGDFPTP